MGNILFSHLLHCCVASLDRQQTCYDRRSNAATQQCFVARGNGATQQRSNAALLEEILAFRVKQLGLYLKQAMALKAFIYK